MSSGGRGVWVAQALENMHVCVIRVSAEEQIKGGEVMAWTAWTFVEYESGSVEGLYPERKWHGGVD